MPRPRGGALALPLLLLLAPLSLASADELFDEFDDGIIAPIYNDLCASGAVESGGAYRYPGPVLGCAGVFGPFPAAIVEVLQPALVIPDNTIVFELRLDHIPTILAGQPSGELVGIGLNPMSSTGLGLNFFLQRVPGGLVVRLFNPEVGQIIQSATVSTTPDTDPALAAADTIELLLELGPNVGNELFPMGSYRLCGPLDCTGSDDPSFTPLVDDPGGVGLDSVALADAPRLTLQGLAQVGEVRPFAAERLEVLPEPGTGVGLVAGVASLAALRRRRSP